MNYDKPLIGAAEASKYQIGDRVWYVQPTGGARIGTIIGTDGDKDGYAILDVQVDGLDHENWGYPQDFTHLSPMA